MGYSQTQLGLFDTGKFWLRGLFFFSPQNLRFRKFTCLLGRPRVFGVCLVGLAALLAMITPLSFFLVFAILADTIDFDPGISIPDFFLWASVLLVPPVGVSLIGALLTALSFCLGKRLLTPSIQQAMAAKDQPPVIYLRGFEADLLATFWEMDDSPKLYRPGEALALVNNIGPMVAIAEPKSIPQLGSYWLFATKDTWQKEVKRLLGEAALVIILGVSSPGVLWEVDQAIRKVTPERLLFYFPFFDAERDARYGRFRENVAEFSDLHLPAAIGDTIFLAFSRTWKPIYYGPHQERSPSEVWEEALKAVLRYKFPGLQLQSDSRLKSRSHFFAEIAIVASIVLGFGIVAYFLMK